MKYIDDFGIVKRSGVDSVDNRNLTTSVAHFGAVHQLVAKVCSPNGTDLEPSFNGADGKSFAQGIAKIPAGSTINAATVVIRNKAKNPSASIKVGTYQMSGAAIDDDGLVAAGVVGTEDAIVGAGALIGKKVAVDSYIKVIKGASEPSGAFEGLDAELIIDYI